jgi:DNA-directed RNA polymerase subunit alpha
MLVIQRPTVEALGEAEGNRQRFAIGPLEPGFGHTLGNSLRRTLLSSIPGAAITQVRFDDALHEFDTISGVSEDVTDIILNLKDIVIRSHSDEPVTLRLDARGPAEVTAAHIQKHADIEVLNEDQHIASRNAKGRLAVDITIGRGRGYASADRNNTSNTIGVIPVDSIFSPVRRVSYDVDTARVGQRTDFDKLRLEVTTDGSMSPKDAVKDAAEILIKYLSIFTDIDASELALRPDGGAAAEVAAPSAHGMENILIEELELGVRSYNCLKRVGIETIGDLIGKTEAELAAIPNFGKKSIEEVKETLAGQGLGLRGSE